jgi:hypothetical protein
VDLEVDELIDLFFKYYATRKGVRTPLNKLDSNMLGIALDAQGAIVDVQGVGSSNAIAARETTSAF